MEDRYLVQMIAEKIGRDYIETEEILDAKIGYVVDDQEQVIQLCINNCNLMNETIPDELFQLQHLKRLSLSTNMLSLFPEKLLQLKKLIRLDLNGNQIRIVTGRITELSALESIDLAGNQLETLPKEIGEMGSLKKIRLNSNRLISLPPLNPDIHWLNLESIDLDGADIKELPTWFFSLKSLKYLSLSKLHLHRFPEEIKRLPKLERIYIDSTLFSYWPERIDIPLSMRCIILDGAHLPKLSETGLVRIPNAIMDLKPRYVRNQNSLDYADDTLQVSLGGNLTAGFDEKKLFHSNPQKSFDYLKELYGKEQKDHPQSDDIRLKDFKIVMLGSGAVGKSSLIQRLHLSNPDDDNIPLDSTEATPGVNIDYSLHLSDVWDHTMQRFQTFTGHFWDFGGQDKYRGINSLLLTDKAIYVIVLDSRAQTAPDVWLDMVSKYAPNSPIIMVANKMDENPRLNINFHDYCERYPKLYNCLFKISCKYQTAGINKISDIIDAIRKILEKDMDAIVPMGRPEYINIQRDVENKYRVHGQAIVKMNEFTELCRSYGLFDEQKQTQLLPVLSMCSTCIIAENEDFFILNPNWLVKYLYLFYNSFSQNDLQCKPVMDYQEYCRFVKNQLYDYYEYIEQLTNYLEQRGLCKVFFDEEEQRRKIFIPMFLSEDGTKLINNLPKSQPTLTYKFAASVIPEYEFQNFFVREFSSIAKQNLDAWQFGIYFIDGAAKIYLQLVHDGIILKIWADDNVKCGKSFQWIRSAMERTNRRNVFSEYVVINNHGNTALLPYKLLDKLNSWKVKLYYLPSENDLEKVVVINVRTISQICGLIGSSFEESINDEELRTIKHMEESEIFMQNQIGQVFGNVIENNYGNANNQYRDIVQKENEIKDGSVGVSDEFQTQLLKLISAVCQETNALQDECQEVRSLLQELQGLLQELANCNPNNREPVKKKIAEWIATAASIVTIAQPLYEHGNEIIKGLQLLMKIR